MKIISYNVNGIRAALKKAHKEQLELQHFEDYGYPYHYWFSAQKKGYSSVAILSKVKPNHIEYGTGIETMDFEGRNLRLDFDDFSVMSLYLPSGTNDARLDFKLNYMAEFQDYVNNLKKEIPNLLICGDYNICHEAIDIHNPKMKNVSGFLPINNKGWRIDYCMASSPMQKMLKRAFILPEAKHSDHCPIGVELEL